MWKDLLAAAYRQVFRLPRRASCTLVEGDYTNSSASSSGEYGIPEYALFPHLNVYDNIAFGLKLKKNA